MKVRVSAGAAPWMGTIIACLVSAGGCRQDMHDQAKYEPFEVSDFFADGQASRMPVANTVARGWLQEDDARYRGREGGDRFVSEIPLSVDAVLLDRGRERFEIFCSPCHGRTGDGEGMIVQRGFHRPETFHQPRLRQMPVGYFFDVVTNGFGEMSGYRPQVPVDDRWAIVAYIRALQISRYVRVADLPLEDRESVARGARVPAAAGVSGAASGGAPTSGATVEEAR